MRPRDVTVVVGELVQVVLMLLGARYVAGKRQHLDVDSVAVGPRPDVGLHLAQVGGVLAVDVGALSVHAVGVDDLEGIAHSPRGHGCAPPRTIAPARSVYRRRSLEASGCPVRPLRLGSDDAGQRLDERLHASQAPTDSRSPASLAFWNSQTRQLANDGNASLAPSPPF